MANITSEINDQIKAMYSFGFRINGLLIEYNSDKSSEIFSLLKKFNLQGRKLEYRRSGLKSLPHQFPQVQELKKIISSARAGSIQAISLLEIISKSKLGERSNQNNINNARKNVTSALNEVKIAERIVEEAVWDNLFKVGSLFTQFGGEEWFPQVFIEFWGGKGYYHHRSREDLNICKKLLSSAVNFRSLNLKEADLSEVHLLGADFTHAELNKSNLSRSNITGCKFNKVDLSDTNFSGAFVSGSDFSDVEIQGANLTGSGFIECNFTNVNFSGMNLSIVRNNGFAGSNFTKANLKRANLQGLTLQFGTAGSVNHRTIFYGADLSHANFSGARINGDFREANLFKANLSNTLITLSDFKEAKFENTRFNGSKIYGSDLSGHDFRLISLPTSILDSNLSGCNFQGVDLSSTELDENDLSGANFDDQTKFPPNFNPKKAGMINVGEKKGIWSRLRTH